MGKTSLDSIFYGTQTPEFSVHRLVTTRYQTLKPCLVTGPSMIPRSNTYPGRARSRRVKRGALGGSRPLGHAMKNGNIIKEFQSFQMDSSLFSIPAFINRTSHVKTLVDGGSESYGLIDARVAARLQLPRLPVKQRGMIAFNKPTEVRISEVAYCSLDITGHYQSRVFFYVVP